MENTTTKIPATTITFTILPTKKTWWQMVFGLNVKNKVRFHHLITTRKTLPIGVHYLGDNNIKYISMDIRKDLEDSTVLVNVDKDWTPRARDLNHIVLISNSITEGSIKNDQN